ncbi:MAG: DMT family transporter [Burkholderiales bacterium]|nr:DMT family transporter [Burkholderiales bacterium]
MSNVTTMTLPAIKGGVLALAAAVLFGLSTPLVQAFGVGLAPFFTAALLYAGAAFIGALVRQPVRAEAALTRADLPRLGLIAAFGAVLGPVALAWGLQNTSGTSASLMLTLEALFTAALARALYRETMDKRVWTAMLLVLAGGIALIADRGLAGGTQFVGLLAVLAATAAWGVDNTLSRALAERDPGQVVLAKSALGVTGTLLLAFLFGETLPAWTQACALIVIGATGYGLSLRFYLLAQRAFGAARTGSVFAFAPFIGAVAALALGDRTFSLWMSAGALLMLAGVVLHLAETHEHEHSHEAMAHEHAHTHDDGHHDHAHDPMPVGSHNHWHEHAPTTHRHAHTPDLHHQHDHKEES